MLVLRPADDARRTAAALARRGHEALVAPVIEIRICSAAIPARDYQAVLLTSANAARALVATPALARLRNRPVLAVGEATAEAAREAGFGDVASAGGAADDLLRLVRHRVDAKGGPLLHPSGRHVANDFGAALAADGYAVERRVVYAAEPVETLPEAAQEALRSGAVDAALLHSPRSARAFGSLAAKAGLADAVAAVTWVCLSPAVADAARDSGSRRIVTAARPEEGALLDALDASTS